MTCLRTQEKFPIAWYLFNVLFLLQIIRKQNTVGYLNQVSLFNFEIETEIELNEYLT